MANRAVCVKRNVPFKLFLVKLRNNIQKLVKHHKVASMMPPTTKIMPTATYSTELLGLPANELQANEEPQLESWKEVKKLSTKHLDLT